MGLCDLKELFCVKITLEIQHFKEEQISMEPEEIYQHSYQIDCMVNIYEYMLEISQELSQQLLISLMLFPNLLAFLFDRWLEREDSQQSEMMRCLKDELKKLEVKEGEAA